MDPCDTLAARREAAERAVVAYVEARGWRRHSPPSAPRTPEEEAELAELSRLIAEEQEAEQALAACYGRDM